MPRFEHDSLSHYYAVSGEGFPLVFVHGLGLSHQNWIGQVPVFARRYRVITYDMRGHGGTGVSSGDTTIRTYSEDLNALLQHLGIERAIFVGYSSGTLICEQFALDYPEKTAALCLIGSYAKVKGVYMSVKTNAGKLTASMGLHKLLAYSVATSNAENLTQRGFFYRIAKRVSDAEALRFLNASERFLDTADLSRIDCPVLLVHGSRDRSTERYARELTAALPNARISVVEGSNHAVATRALSVFNVLLDEWLQHLPLHESQHV